MTTRTAVGVDVGGSFTDVVYSSPEGIRRAKAPTNPQDFGEGVLAGLALIADQLGQELSAFLASLEKFGLGTTAVTNVIAELNGSPVGLLTTRGFEYELDLAVGIRPSDASGRVNAPAQIVSRRCIIGLDERVDRSGAILRSLDAGEAVSAARTLVDERGCRALAISLVNAYQYAGHEEQVAAVVRAAHPDLPVFVGTELTPIIGFFQRTMLTVLNAFTAASLDGVEKFVTRVRSNGLEAPLRLVNAAAGAIGVHAARRAPMMLMHSGPAAGVSAAAAIARTHALGQVIACDMGGTSFDVSVITDGRPLRKVNAEVLQVPTSMSVVDVESIGSGGGSIGWTDARRMLHVGPLSARSMPGPACYRRGGTRPTVTDALVVLGYIDPGNFLGGSMQLDRDAAVAACATVGEEVGLGAIDLAQGIRSLALADMVAAVRLVTNRRGLNVRDHAIVSYGGCGGLFTAEIAAELGITTVVVPEVASVLSAYGAATAPVRHERSQSLAVEMPVPAASFEATLQALTSAVNKDLDEDHVAELEREITFDADLRYKGQRFELSLPVPEAESTEAVIEILQEHFFDAYRTVYGSGSSLLGAPVELVTLRVVGREADQGDSRAAAGEIPARQRDPWVPQPAGGRQVPSATTGELLSVAVYDGASLGLDAEIQGPACLDKVDTTVWIPPGATGALHPDGSLVVRFAPADPEGDANR